MASGFDWFRWHHGSVTDPKFQLVAKRADVRLGDVMVVWAFALESASANPDRGVIGPLDFETLDFLLGMDDGTAARILDAMTQRGLIGADGRITRWDSRQPKREREGDSSTDRVRAFRQKQRNETPGNATERQETPREEESREEKKSIEEADASSRRQRSASDVPDCPYQSVVDLYHDRLPDLPSVRVMDEKRKRCIKAFWVWVLTSKRSDGQRRANDADQALTWIGQYFERASSNDFVMGRTGRTGDHQNWRADIEYLCGEKGRKQVIERTVDVS